MGLGSVFQTALSGINAAQFAIGVSANNLANARTDGFKASEVSFASSRSGGTNPTQVGSGVLPGASSPNFTQGTIALDGGPTNLALQGDGLFILEGDSGERRYTRDGNFGVNAAGQLVSQSGSRVLGFGSDENFQLDTTRLVPLEVASRRTAAAADGTAAALTGFNIAEDGRIIGAFSDGVTRDLGQIQIGRFVNSSGLEQRGDTQFSEGANSGLVVVGSPMSGGGAKVVAGARELSNTDIGRELVNQTLASNQFRANLAVMSVSEELFDDLMFLRRKE